MGIFNKLFGGARIEVTLPSNEFRPGDEIAGSVTIGSERKALQVTEIWVRLYSIFVHPVKEPEDGSEASPIPAIDTDRLVERSMSADIELAPGSEVSREFSLTVPADAKPSGAGQSYKLQVTATIPRAAAPKADFKIEILAAE